MGNGMFMSFIAFIGMGEWRCYWHGRTAMQDGDAIGMATIAWQDGMATIAWQDADAGWRCYWRGRMAMQDGDAIGMATIAMQDGDAIGMGGWHGRMAEQTP